MSVKRRCTYCNKIFDARSTKHLYCSRKCYKYCYNLKQKKDIVPPTLTCQNCRNIIKLNFFPAKKGGCEKLKHITCKQCGYKFSSNLNDEIEREDKDHEHWKLFFS